MDIDKSVIDRFWDKVDVRGPDDCWEWTASKSRGYGQMSSRYGESPYKAHRLSWEIHNGDPADLCVLHTCDNPSCVNPAHLFLGTQRDNVHDMVSKGRSHGSQQRREENPAAILTEEDVAHIRSMYLTASFRPKDISAAFPVSYATVQSVLQNRSWHDPSYDPKTVAGKVAGLPRPERRVLDDDGIESVLKMTAEGMSSRAIAKALGVSKPVVLKVRNGVYK